MPHQTPSDTIDTDRIEAISLELQRQLVSARAALADEIRNYPTPIPRCDAQFNHLVDRRGHLSQLLTELNGALDRRDSRAALRIVLTQACDPPPFGDSIEEHGLRDRIRAELARA